MKWLSRAFGIATTCAVVGASWTASADVAVIGLGGDGAAPPLELVAALEEVLAARGDVMRRDAAMAALTHGQRGAGGEALVTGLVSDLQAGVDAYYAFQTEDSEKLLSESVAVVAERPLLLVQYPQLAEATKTGALIYSRLLSDRQDYEGSEAAVRALVEQHPTWRPSRQNFDPATVELVESSRAQLGALGKQLVFAPLGGADGCGVNLNGDMILLDAEQVVPVASRDYGLELQCGQTAVGPFRVTPGRASQTLPLGPAVLDALMPLTENRSPDLPAGWEHREAVGEALQVLLGVEAVYIVASDADGFWLGRVDANGLRAATSANADASALLGVVERGRPAPSVAYDATGLGWERVAEASPEPSEGSGSLDIAAYVLLGLGGASAATGGALLAVAATSQTDALNACKTEACTEDEIRERSDTINGTMLGGQIALGVGGALLVTGVVLLVLDMTEDSDTQAWGVDVRPDGATATWRMSW